MEHHKANESAAPFYNPSSWRIVGDAVTALEDQAAVWIRQLVQGQPYDPPPGPRVAGWIQQHPSI